MKKDTAIVRNIETGDLYRHITGNEFQNIRTGKTGMVTDELAKKFFRINVEASLMLNSYPHIEELIRKLDLKLEK